MRNIYKITLGSLLFSLASCGASEEPIKKEKQIDYSKYPNYVSNVDSIVYDFSGSNIVSPFWKGNVIYNETVLMSKDPETNLITGNLLFKPLKILAVKDYTLNTTDYVEGEDFTISNNQITLTENSKCPYLDKRILAGDTSCPLPSGFNLVQSISNVKTDCVLMGPAYYSESPLYYGYQLQVSYVYDLYDIDEEIDKYPSFDTLQFEALMDKFNKKEDVTITAIGDSVLEGCSSSKKFDHEPYLDNFMTLTANELSNRYGSKVTLKNLSVGGKTSDWGAEQSVITSINNTNPDLVFIHFGINDLGNGSSTRAYTDNILLIVDGIKKANPNTGIIILTPFGPNPNLYDYEKLNDYFFGDRGVEKKVLPNYENVEILDILSLSKLLYKTKKYADMTGNGINHVNDFASRIYAMAILAKFYEF